MQILMLVEDLIVFTIASFVMIMAKVIKRRGEWANIFATGREFYLINPKEEAR